jgi:NAD(P)H dehydrogenase (quinone)
VHVYVVFAHPSRDSFTWQVLNSFLAGLEEAGHEVEVGDLYEMDFETDMDLEQYERETGGDPDAPVPEDVRLEQKKIERADALAFVFPVWWSDCPAKLKGWFDRVLTYGYAYTYDDGEHKKSKIDVRKAIVICPAGHPVEYLEETGIAESMRRIILQDRLIGVGVREGSLEILGGMAAGDEVIRKRNIERALELGRDF